MKFGNAPRKRDNDIGAFDLHGLFRWLQTGTPAPVPAPRTRRRPVPAPRTTIRQTEKALRNYTSSYEVAIRDSRDSLVQVNGTKKKKAMEQERLSKNAFEAI